MSVKEFFAFVFVFVIVFVRSSFRVLLRIPLLINQLSVMELFVFIRVIR